MSLQRPTLEACTMSSPSLRRCTVPSRMMSGTLSSLSARPYSANAALCCRFPAEAAQVEFESRS